MTSACPIILKVVISWMEQVKSSKISLQCKTSCNANVLENSMVPEIYAIMVVPLGK
ncbi:hypothetical protein Lalb_Chr01g0010831 [Lupinus albus]|uniref:Uncharacterized protein n=1 Tax=Lupinus albus TaxID=3870 RepID=A0A6A4R639_LUPAL|nr:hypothetical protein Lalb_Chr01g0010831 [Lupinus albus]